MRYAGIDLRAALLRVLALAVAFAMALMWAAFVAEHAVYATGTGTGAKNVLLIQTDHEFFYGYGTERDPGIIRENYSDFQSRAVSFPNAKSVCPLCSPARRSVLTGVYPHQQGSDGLEQQLSWEQFRTYAALTYAQTTMVDDAIGTILDTLEETGLADDTIVIWTNDHGDALGSHGGHVDKDSYITEEVNAIAMAVYDPDLEEECGGTECDALVNTLDVPVTMLGAYGLQFRNEEVTGMNMLDLIGNESLWRKYLVTEMNGHTNEVYTRVVYWKNYKYVYYFNDIDELYDLDADPYEMTNLIYEDSVSGVADLLKSYLYEWQLETGDIVPLINL